VARRVTGRRRLQRARASAIISGEVRHIDVYAGREHLGSVEIGQETIRALTPEGNEIGTFPTRDEAREAVTRAAELAR
jgi:hypothetical protein